MSGVSARAGFEIRVIFWHKASRMHVYVTKASHAGFIYIGTYLGVCCREEVRFCCNLLMSFSVMNLGE
eukprot:1389269-Amorphochlora_amoeboformis.AAC.1